jgi:hypothetical protein
MANLLVEQINNGSHSLMEARVMSDGGVIISGKIHEAERINGNHRNYPKPVLEREIETYINESVKGNRALGELDHPESSVINLNNVCHLIKNIWWKGNEVWGDLELLDTPAGRIAKELVKKRIPVGISSRGMGSVQQIGETVEVQNDYSLLCFDLVSTPSTPSAYLSLKEGLLVNSVNPYGKVNGIITDILCSKGFCSCSI